MTVPFSTIAGMRAEYRRQSACLVIHPLATDNGDKMGQSKAGLSISNAACPDPSFGTVARCFDLPAVDDPERHRLAICGGESGHRAKPMLPASIQHAAQLH
ncbi:hypothetical protein J8I87_20900 [Paraburkholderia sp. LEh10]|uniref:hypothetical protein n=1 Tax=Paraburkholderia sp. LEh10 TaxID=2821353 RepID=UPI001AEB8DCF|nr:hypothetical protein [Paraburkholderia sp. LEh10]MBP0592142.1 hypothetical protein [Paraburkholderia sp. LEh10]